MQAQFNMFQTATDVQKSSCFGFLFQFISEPEKTDQDGIAMPTYTPPLHFMWHNVRVCRTFICSLYSISLSSLSNYYKNALRNDFQLETKRGKKNKGNVRPRTADAEKWIRAYAIQYGSSDPQGRQSFTKLDASTTIKMMHDKYTLDPAIASKGPPLQYSAFNGVFNGLKLIQIMKIRTGMCSVCMHTTGDVKAAHVALKDSRNTFLKRKLQEAQDDAKAEYISVDWAMSYRLPYLLTQHTQLFFQSGLVVENLGIYNEKINRQSNYLLTEGKFPKGKALNQNASILFHYLKNSATDTTSNVLYLQTDNCPGQFKNQYFVKFLAWYVLTSHIETISHNLAITGHTKFAPDRCFGLIRKKMNKFACRTVEDLTEAVTSSSVTNTAISGSSVEWYDWVGFLDQFFTKGIANISKMHHFTYNLSDPGIVSCAPSHDVAPIPFRILRDGITLKNIRKPNRPMEEFRLKNDELSSDRRDQLTKLANDNEIPVQEFLG